MKINELIKKIREDHSYSLSEIGEKVGFAKENNIKKPLIYGAGDLISFLE